MSITKPPTLVYVIFNLLNMRKIYYIILAAGILFTSCSKEESSEITESKNITKEVKAEVINGETTVTITTTENGETKTEILTGQEAEAYMEKDPMENMDLPEGANVIVKNMDHDVNIDIDVDKILNDPELQDLDEETKEKIKHAIENSLDEMEVDVQIEHSSNTSGTSEEPIIKTKVMVIDESK